MSRRYVVGLMFLVCCLASCLIGTDAWIVREDGIGPVKVGMTIGQLKAALHEKLSEQESGSGNCYYVTSREHAHLAFMIIGGRVVRVDVDASGIRTSSGLQVGDSEAHARQVYGQKLKVTSHQYIDTGRYLTVRSADGRHGIRFETDKGKITSFYVGTYESIQYVEGCE